MEGNMHPGFQPSFAAIPLPSVRAVDSLPEEIFGILDLISPSSSSCFLSSTIDYLKVLHVVGGSASVPPQVSALSPFSMADGPCQKELWDECLSWMILRISLIVNVLILRTARNEPVQTSFSHKQRLPAPMETPQPLV